MSTADKLNKLLETKQAIKQAIINKGVEVSEDTKFSEYPAKITAIQTGDADSVWGIVTNNWTRFEYLFHNCKSLTSLDVSNWNTSNATNMINMFYYCNKLTSLDASNWNTSKVTNMSNMFTNCKSLTSLNVSNFNTSNVTAMSHMFSYCYELTELDVSNFNISKVTDMNYMFYYCEKLTELDVSHWDVGHITAYYYIQDAFNYCKSLVDFYPPQNFNANMNFNNSTALSHDSLIRIINNLMTTTSTKTLNLGTTNLAKLSDDEKAIATNKGWTLK